MAKIPLTQHKEAIIDDEDLHKVSMHKWQFDGRYASRRESGRKVYMHRVIVSNESKEDTDHINRNKLDNRKANLRICDRTTNNFNQAIRSDNKSGHKGVSWHRDARKWRSRLVLHGKEINLGVYSKLEDAIKARESYAKNIL